MASRVGKPFPGGVVGVDGGGGGPQTYWIYFILVLYNFFLKETICIWNTEEQLTKCTTMKVPPSNSQ